MELIFSQIFSDLQKLYTASALITVLTLLSLWAWKLIFDVNSMLRVCNAKESSFYKRYEDFCQDMNKLSLNKRTEMNLLTARARKEVRPIMQNVSTILLLSSVAPFLGLLGTVQGMIHTFDVLSNVQAISNAQLTHGISEALLTTQCGLMVAIPTLLVGGILYRKAQKVQNKLRIIALHSVESV